MRFAAFVFVAISSLLLLHFGSVRSMSDSYGQNPQHEFGAVWGQTLSPLIPFWTLEGDAFANQDFVRLVPDRQSKRGGMWNTEPNRFQSWEATFSIHVHGVSLVGADGLAFWYTKETSELNGGFFGFTDQFTGLGIVIDTYDNDNTGLHPLLVAIVNDGTKKYTHSHDHQAATMEVGNCQLGIRNLAGTSIIKVTYRGRQLKVETQLYGAATFSPCLIAENVDLPTKHHFGFTAATGQLADNHDVYGFSVRNLDPNAPAIDSQRVFSNYDKYQISEFLSKIYYEVSQGDEPNDKRDTNSVNKVTRTLEKLEGDLKAISKSIAALDSKLDGKAVGGTAGGNNAGLATELASLKSAISTLTQKVSSVGVPASTQQQPQQPQQQAATSTVNVPPFNQPNSNVFQGIPQANSGSSVLSIIFYIFLIIVVLGLAYLGFLYYRIKTEKEKKFF